MAINPIVGSGKYRGDTVSRCLCQGRDKPGAHKGRPAREGIDSPKSALTGKTWHDPCMLRPPQFDFHP